ncbi:hypothetical protein [Aeromicrobium sp.]|uniref:hypothetical protein n=1 Tax=Aeromicrobium sp. TaxID=1871063 RepID=UPI0019C0B041|nr:hypothetical protein [Aeromicrobium sp.]MBC7629888.1 hypothetical protein [Aeromicrobium sp.]
MRVLASAMALLLVLAGCGGSSEKAATSTDSTQNPSTAGAPGATSPLQSPTGVSTPEALSRFRCVKGSKGRWTASGHLSNDSKNKVTFQVTVYVGQATGGAEEASTKQVSDVAGGDSVTFMMGAVPAPKDGGRCYVQVLVTK